MDQLKQDLSELKICEEFPNWIRNSFKQSSFNQSLSKKGTLEVCGLLVDAEQPRIPPKKLKAYRSMIRKLTFKETLSESEIKKLKGTLSFVNMVYGCIPNRLSKPLEKLYLVHPQLKSNVYKPQVKFSLYSKSH